MKQLKSLYFAFFTCLFLSFMMNGILFYTTNCTTQFIQGTDVWGTTYITERNLLQQKSKLMKSLPENQNDSILMLTEHINLFRNYQTAALYLKHKDGEATQLKPVPLEKLSPEGQSFWELEKPLDQGEALSLEDYYIIASGIYNEYVSSYTHTFDSIDTSLATIEKELLLYESVLKQYTYVDSYDTYLQQISDASDQLVNTSLYDTNGTYLKNNILKTKNDFYKLQSVSLTPVMEEGFVVLDNYKVTDWIACFMMVLAAFFLFLILHNQANNFLHYKKYVLLWSTFAFLFTLCFMYLTNYLMASKHLAIPDLKTSIQSLSMFTSCPYVISIGTYCILRLLLKLSFFFIYFFILLQLLTRKKKILYVVLSITIGITSLEYICSIYSKSNPILLFFREINILSMLQSQRFFTRYLNLNLFNYAVSRLPVFLCMIAITMIIVVRLTTKQLHLYVSSTVANAEEVYYDEINLRYLETRQIWHDLHNHLLAINTLIERGDTVSAKKYIQEVSEEIDLNILPVKTDSPVLDALFYKKKNQAQQHGIELSLDINCSFQNTGITDYDLCSIFGNLLDNAIEALIASKVSEKTISLTINQKMNLFYISCSNSYDTKLMSCENSYRTTKQIPQQHGLGLSRLRQLSKKYHGEMKITTEQQVFKVELLLSIEHN